MDQELEQALAEALASLREIQQLRLADQDNAELLQLERELQEAVDSLKASLRAEQAVPASSAQQHSPPDARQKAATATVQEQPVVPFDRPAKRQKFTPTQPGMHPSNQYATEEPDFAALAREYPELQHFLRAERAGRASLAFDNPDANRMLSKVLLHHDYGITWSLPPGHLIPPVPNRANYIHWIEDLLRLSHPAEMQVTQGLDVGCGANLIYPLLGAAINGWRFVGVDVMPVALEWAEKNRVANPHLADLITVRPVKIPNDDPAHPCSLHQGVLKPAIRSGETFAFSMSNPPFFEAIEEAGRNPKTAFSGTPAEMVCPGGEYAFVECMVQDSLRLQGRIHWYTTMLGRKASLKRLRTRLHACGVSALRTTEFIQGRTTRWGLAWSFAVRPDTAQQALPRPSAAGPAEIRPSNAIRRLVLFTLQGLGHRAEKVLKLLQTSLEAHGAQCTADAASFCISANLPIPHSPPAAGWNADEGPSCSTAPSKDQGMPGQADTTVETGPPVSLKTGGGDDQPAMSVKLGAPGSRDNELDAFQPGSRPVHEQGSIAIGPPDSTGPVPAWRQPSTDKAQPDSPSIGPIGPPSPLPLPGQPNPCLHRLRPSEPQSRPEVHEPCQKGKQDQSCQLKLTLLQQPGQGRIPELVVKASVPANTSDAAARHFTSIMDRAEEDLRILLAG
ncbi:hypothetical protein WJX74_005744 [Apatococcus lobatus]|uniref:U6 small nuclear RNA (adenine-(43)-N(6))-methyltransferase n=1 Tax=Apatococcus lobatus TaxID=904363 RepID=A0AAW1RPI9_9CHLO